MASSPRNINMFTQNNIQKTVSTRFYKMRLLHRIPWKSKRLDMQPLLKIKKAQMAEVEDEDFASWIHCEDHPGHQLLSEDKTVAACS